jgi:hypothetical protein
MEKKLHLEILPQPDETTCGPTCLQAVYQYYGDAVPLPQVVREVKSFDAGGTLAVWLGCHALSRGYRATIFTYDLQVFDPTWFTDPSLDMTAKLRLQKELKNNAKLHLTTDA